MHPSEWSWEWLFVMDVPETPSCILKWSKDRWKSVSTFFLIKWANRPPTGHQGFCCTIFISILIPRFPNLLSGSDANKVLVGASWIALTVVSACGKEDAVLVWGIWVPLLFGKDMYCTGRSSCSAWKKVSLIVCPSYWRWMELPFPSYSVLWWELLWRGQCDPLSHPWIK